MNKYFLTQDLEILYCPSLKLTKTCRVLNVETFEFVEFRGEFTLEKYYRLNDDDISYIVNNILNSKIGHELNEKELDWILSFEKYKKENKNISKRLLFNYLILKLKLIGFSDNLSKDVALKFLNMDGFNAANFLKAINLIISKKEIWIPISSDSKKYLDERFLIKVFTQKEELSYEFNFDVFKDEYFNLLSNSFLSEIVKFNKKKSYLNKKILMIKESKEDLKDIYRYNILGIVEYVVNSKFQRTDDIFVNVLIDELMLVVDEYLEVETTRGEDCGSGLNYNRKKNGIN